jgi:hypothetical protein
MSLGAAGMVKETHWRYYRFWLSAIFLVETLMLILNHALVPIYFLIAGVFLIGFLLRVFRLYPGEAEPLILDFSGMVIAVIFAYLAQWLGDSPGRFLLIFCSSAIIVPHFIYIALKK